MNALTRLFTGTSLEGTPGRSRFAELEAKGRVRLDQSHEINPSIGFSGYLLESHDPAGRIPNELVDASVAFATPVTEIEDWVLFASVGLGYAGDPTADASRSLFAKATLSAGREISPDEHLLIWLDYDGNRQLFPDVPLPFFEYHRQFGEEFSLTLGIPECRAEWKPAERLTLAAAWDAPFTFACEATYDLSDTWSARLRYTDETHAFHQPGEPRTHRIFFDEQRIELGLAWKPSKNAALCIAPGFAFSREFSTGFDDRSQTTLAHVGDGAYLSVQLSLMF